jgi:hypothetical protein
VEAHKVNLSHWLIFTQTVAVRRVRHLDRRGVDRRRRDGEDGLGLDAARVGRVEDELLARERVRELADDGRFAEGFEAVKGIIASSAFSIDVVILTPPSRRARAWRAFGSPGRIGPPGPAASPTLALLARTAAERDTQRVAHLFQPGDDARHNRARAILERGPRPGPLQFARNCGLSSGASRTFEVRRDSVATGPPNK